jgi:hypothetical protein
MVFYGDTILHIGQTATTSNGVLKAKREPNVEFTVPEDEHLLGC